MIQFNLLPDVKLEFIRTRRTKHLVSMVCSIVIAVSLVVLVGLFSLVNIVQHERLNQLDTKIAKDTQTLKAIPDLNKVLTIQNQLGALTALHEQSPATSRLFDYMAKLTPASASLSDVKIDFNAKTLSISGSADNLTTVNQYADTLKFTTYTVAGENNSNPPHAFSNVVLTSFSVNANASNPANAVSYEIDCNFDATIFDNTKNVTLTTPHIISTRSETEKPSDLFQKVTTPTSGGQ